MNNEKPRFSKSENTLDHIQTLIHETKRTAWAVGIPNVERLRENIRRDINPTLIPWRYATKLATMARASWSLDPGPVTTETLSDIFEVAPKTIIEGNDVPSPMNVGFRDNHDDMPSLFLRKSPFPANRRFALLRLIGDHLTAPHEDRLLPAAQRSKTHRQKFQRAFAQEFLCPYEHLLSYLGTDDPTNEVLEEAARHFDVSPLTVQTILVNKGELSRDRLPVGSIRKPFSGIYSEPPLPI